MPGPITRQRTGCSTCRKRKIKCDESKPSCRNCIRNSKGCIWTKDLRFVIDNHALKRNGTTPLAPIAKRPKIGNENGQTAQFEEKEEHTKVEINGNGTKPVVPNGSPISLKSSQSYKSIETKTESSTENSDDLFLPTAAFLSGHLTQAYGNGSQVFDASVTEICRSNSAKLRDSIDLEHQSPIPPNLNPNPEGFTDWRTLQASEVVQKALNSDQEIQLLNNYIWECAPWFDAHNSMRHFSKKDVKRMMNCPPWRAAAMALSAKNLELRKGSATNSDSLSLHLYQLSVSLAIDSISGRFDCVGTLAGCVLLSVYEMMTVSYTDWRRHLQGCASIFTHNIWNGSTGGLISAAFWDYARIDIWAAFCSSTETLISPKFWFNDPDSMMALSNVDEDTHAQISTWLLARTVNLVHNVSEGESPGLSPEFNLLQADLKTFESMGSVACRPVIHRDACPEEDIPFPRILFSSHSSTIAYTMFHTAMVLILEFEQSKTVGGSPKLMDAVYDHSRKACGIIETNDHTACLVNSLQPMWICGRNLRTRGEKFAALEILAQIEKRTGWACSWRSSSLREHWNLS